jgi:hypothetical protein
VMLWSGIFFKLVRCGYTLRVTSQASYSPEYITPTQKNHGYRSCWNNLLRVCWPHQLCYKMITTCARLVNNLEQAVRVDLVNEQCKTFMRVCETSR